MQTIWRHSSWNCERTNDSQWEHFESTITINVHGWKLCAISVCIEIDYLSTTFTHAITSIAVVYISVNACCHRIYGSARITRRCSNGETSHSVLWKSTVYARSTRRRTRYGTARRLCTVLRRTHARLAVLAPNKSVVIVCRCCVNSFVFFFFFLLLLFFFLVVRGDTKKQQNKNHTKMLKRAREGREQGG